MSGAPVSSAASLLAWLREEAWPLWLEHGVDRARGGFHEALDLRTLQSPEPFRRLRVAARQVYVFSQAHRFGLTRAGEAVELGIAFLRERARRADGGYARLFDLEGRVTDAQRDLYDHAFVLLALSSAARVLPAAPLRQEALALLRYLDGHLAHPLGGYAEGLPPSLPRRQNPHMHLLEALLAAAEAFGDDLFLHRATGLVDLFLTRFRDPRTGSLPEYYAEDLTPEREGGRHVLEAGHHCEWVWLLGWHARLVGERPDVAEAMAGLLRFVDRYGINPRLGTLYDELWSDGAVKAAGSRLWPQTERLKSEALRPGATATGFASAAAALRRHLDGAPPGLWHERLDEHGRPSGEPAPASSLYHLTAGILTAAEVVG
ncbi:AGE family epimerase/isomerase [Muricoccus aerilatus]|uniref:AGE family epimerase/isomerase n=1 Tax=Muricoccus aerilatus TaxID=452982 RepID=UPI000693CE22|nr:AGE family epimerase/isomerase [Roseomonas aerilata]